MTIAKFFIALIVLLQLSGCASTVNVIDKQKNPFRYTQNTAVIIVGAIGESSVGNLTATTISGKNLFLASDNHTSNINTFAWKIDIGDTFSLTEVEMPDWYKKIELSKSHTLSIDTSGIYYYGTILSKDKNILLIKKALPMLIHRAKEKYPYVFNELRANNFK